MPLSLSSPRSATVVAFLVVSACSSSSGNDATPATPAVPDRPGDRDGGATPDDASSGDASKPDATPPVDVAQAVSAFDDAVAKAVCKMLASCCSDADYDAYFGRFKGKPYDLKTTPSRADCEKTLRAEIGIVHAKWTASAKKGRITFDAVKAQACVDAVNAASCGLPLTKVLYDDACFGIRGNAVFTKVTPLGAACDDIADGTFYGECDPKLGFCGTSKTCEAWRKTGESCQAVPTRQFCAPELSCDGATPSKPGTCSPPPVTRQLGETCTSASGPLEECVTGTFCNFDSGKCEAKKPNGAACGFDDECIEQHPFTCAPFGSGTCGQTTFCSGAK